MIDQLELSRRARIASALAHATLDPTADTAPLEKLVHAAAAAAGAATGAVTLLSDVQVTASIVGSFLESELGEERPFEDTICVNALRTGATLVIPDTASDHRVSSLPQVVSGAVGSYLGAPLRTTDNDMVGVLCVFDDHPREWTDLQVAEVSRVAGDVMTEIARLEAETR